MLHLQQSGKGNPIILLHGFCENSTCFNKQVFLLSKEYNVITMDLPGVGNSPFSESLSMEKCADEVHRTLMHHDITKGVMIGHSMGGYITLSFAKKYGEMLNGFGLLHSTANADSDERKLKRDQAIQVIREKGFEFYVTNFIPPLFASTFSDKELVDLMITEGLRTTSDNVVAQIIAMKTRHESTAFLKETDLPVLFIAGKADSIIPVKDMIAQSAMVNQGMIEVLEQSAHMGMLEEPEKCAAAISRFAAECF